jgi:parvulin-like peptidyl-prolyl isomerase
MRHLLLAAILTMLAPLRAAEPQVLDGVAAVVNEDVITFTQVRELTGPAEAQVRSNLTGAALTERIKEMRLRAVNDLIDRQLIIQEFRKLKGASIPPHVVNDRITALIRDDFGGDRSAFLKTIAAQGLTLERIRRMEEEKVIVSAMRSREVKGDPMVPKSRIESFYNEHRQDWTTNDEVKLRMIKIVPGDDPAKKRKMIEEIRDKIVRGADFADLARIYSEDSTQDKGGEWGWVRRGELSAEMERAVFGLKTGKVSDVLTLSLNKQEAFYLLLAEERKPGVTKPLKELRDQIEKHLVQQERQKMQQGWIERLRKKAYIKIY